MSLTNLALGRACVSNTTLLTPETTEDRISILEKRISELTKVICGIRKKGLHTINKDGLTIGLSLIGISHLGLAILTVKEDGYYIGETYYTSLSAAAEGASGVRRSGWTFWKLADGRTIREAFRQ